MNVPLIVITIAVGALAWRGGAGVVEFDRLESMRPNVMMRHPGIASFAYLYLYFAIIAGIANGYAILGVKGLVILPIVTWVVFQAIDVLISLNRGLHESLVMNPIVHLVVFGPMYFLLTGGFIWSLVAA